MAGVTLSDRKLGAEVRKLVLSKAKKILMAKYPKGSEDEKWQRTVLEKLLTTALPRQTELSDPEGKPLVIQFSQQFNARATSETS